MISDVEIPSVLLVSLNRPTALTFIRRAQMLNVKEMIRERDQNEINQLQLQILRRNVLLTNS